MKTRSQNKKDQGTRKVSVRGLELAWDLHKESITGHEAHNLRRDTMKTLTTKATTLVATVATAAAMLAPSTCEAIGHSKFDQLFPDQEWSTEYKELDKYDLEQMFTVPEPTVPEVSLPEDPVVPPHVLPPTPPKTPSLPGDIETSPEIMPTPDLPVIAPEDMPELVLEPELSLPEDVTLPDEVIENLNPHLIDLPEVKAPEVKAPEVKAPEVKAPEAPAIEVPEIALPNLEQAYENFESALAMAEERIETAKTIGERYWMKKYARDYQEKMENLRAYTSMRDAEEDRMAEEYLNS